MHLNVCYFVLVHTNLSNNGEKDRFHVQNCPCGTVGANKMVEMNCFKFIFGCSPNAFAKI